MADFNPDLKSPKWPFWTWALSLLILLFGSLVSFYLRNFTDSLLLYLPTAMAIVLVHWFGLRVLPLTYINSFFTLWIWGAPGSLGYLLLLATREPVIVFASWALANHKLIRSNGLASTKSFVSFVILGVVIPDTINSFYTYQYTFINKDLEKVLLLWLSDFITIFSIALPLLHFFRPVPSEWSFRIVRNKSFNIRTPKVDVRALFVVTVLFLGLSFIMDFSRYWFVYGIVASIVAVRFGFETVIVTNAVIFLLNYILPLTEFGEIIQGTTQRLNVHLGMGTMYFVSSIIGRAVSDLLDTEAELKEQKKQIELSNEKLIRANQEMDRFVYSVSHDISAPLKSIMGLISLSRIEQKSPESSPYLDKIEISARKLEDFVAEVLDHSRASRKEISLENIPLKNKALDIIENLKYLDKNQSTQFKVAIPDALVILSDRFLIKVVLSNIISNAIKYQKKIPGHTPEINIVASGNEDVVSIKIHDNGQGIHDDNKSRIFDMFYRGTSLSSGSGLGLYIAKEAIERLNGTISFESAYGESTTFTLTIPLVPALQ